MIGILKVIGFNYEPYLWNDCHGLMQNAMNFDDVAIFSVKEIDFRIHFRNMSKDDAINTVENSNLNEGSVLL